MEQSVSSPADRRSLSGALLKYIACGSMLLDHIGASCLEAGVFQGVSVAGLWASGTPRGLLVLDILLRSIGRLAFPLYCFLLVEGLCHTHSIRRYALRLLAFALLSEVPFDWAFFRTPVYWQYQNVYWTLLLGLAALAALRHSDRDGGPSARGYALALGCAVLAELLHTDYGALGVLLIAALYLLRADRTRQCVTGALLTAYEITAPLAFVLAWKYNGRRGRGNTKALYLFYPVHLTVLAMITNCILG